ncbi:MAG TPA: ABC transporter permease, partial [Aggregicoccus sp.]|nr:ABC transporter permease [Aggregicoccus sp.]
MNAERQTVYRWSLVWAGALVALVGLGLLITAVTRAGGWGGASAALAGSLFAWGPLPQLLGALNLTGVARGVTAGAPLLAGAAVWLVGWGLVAAGIQRAQPSAEGPSAAAGAPLYPRLAAYRDFYWSTLAAYGGGMLLAELAFLLLQTFLASGVRFGDLEGAAADEAGLQLPPTGAFLIALAVSALIAFVAGFVGASRARRMSVPEATLGVIYLGAPIPLLLTLMGSVPALQRALRYRLDEVTYLAGLLGRPELGYWLIFAFLVLCLVLGINSGFIAAGSGRLDLRSRFELFVARRHVSVFRPRLILGTLAVLLFGIVPPLIIYGIIAAAEAAVERTRIRALGLKDPLAAAEAQNRLKLREQSPTAMMTALSVGGVGVGVMALIIVLSVMSGFEADLQQKILGTHAHAVVSKYGAEGMEDYPRVLKEVAKVPGVKGQTPFILNQVMIIAEGNVDGVVIKGIDPGTVGSVTDLPQNILPPGKLDWLANPEHILTAPSTEGPSTRLLTPPSGLDLAQAGAASAGEGSAQQDEPEEVDPIIGKMTQPRKSKVLPGIFLGRELAAALHVFVGDRVNVVSPLGSELGPSGPIPKQRPFRVAGIFYTGMYEYDSKFVYILLGEAQDFFAVRGAHGIELKVEDIDDARRIGQVVVERLGGFPYRAKDWGEMNKNLFSALRLEKLVMGIILTIIIIVAAGLIVATVIMLVLEKRKEISVLKALGVSDSGIVKIFLAEGLQIGVAGGLLGLLSGYAWCKFIERVGLKLDPEVYYIPKLPVKVEPLQTAMAVLIAILVTYLGSIYPALKASRVEPVEGLKAE